MNLKDIPPFDAAAADRQLELRMAHARYRNARPNSLEKDEAFKVYRDLLKDAQDRGEHR